MAAEGYVACSPYVPSKGITFFSIEVMAEGVYSLGVCKMAAFSKMVKSKRFDQKQVIELCKGHYTVYGTPKVKNLCKPR